MRRRSAQWGAILARRHRARSVAVAPQFYRGASPVGNSARALREVRTTTIPPSTASRTPMTENELSHRSRPFVVLGGGPAGLTAGYLLARRGKPGDRPRGRPTRSAASRGPRCATATASTSAATASSPRSGGRRALARDHGGGVPAAPAPVAHLLARASSSSTRSRAWT